MLVKCLFIEYRVFLHVYEYNCFCREGALQSIFSNVGTDCQLKVTSVVINMTLIKILDKPRPSYFHDGAPSLQRNTDQKHTGVEESFRNSAARFRMLKLHPVKNSLEQLERARLQVSCMSVVEWLNVWLRLGFLSPAYLLFFISSL